MGLLLIEERRFLFSEFALSKSQYSYNKFLDLQKAFDNVDLEILPNKRAFDLLRRSTFVDSKAYP